jgi:hypothetical protein
LRSLALVTASCETTWCRISTGTSIRPKRAGSYLAIYEEALHVQFYLTLLDTYVTEPAERDEAFAAVENIPSTRG